MNFVKYERELKVPYYLIFYPDAQELTLYRLRSGKYVTVKPNRQGRYPIPKLEMEVAILDGWVRYRFRGQLLPLPAELHERLQQAEERARQAEARVRQVEEQALQAEERARQAEAQALQAKERAELERQQKEQLRAKLRELGIEPGLE